MEKRRKKSNNYARHSFTLPIEVSDLLNNNYLKIRDCKNKSDVVSNAIRTFFKSRGIK